MRSSGALAQVIPRGLHRLPLDSGRNSRVHHKLGKAVSCLVQRFGAYPQCLQIIALPKDAKLRAQRVDFGTFVGFEQLPCGLEGAFSTAFRMVSASFLASISWRR